MSGSAGILQMESWSRLQAHSRPLLEIREPGMLLRPQQRPRRGGTPAPSPLPAPPLYLLQPCACTQTDASCHHLWHACSCTALQVPCGQHDASCSSAGPTCVGWVCGAAHKRHLYPQLHSNKRDTSGSSRCGGSVPGRDCSLVCTSHSTSHLPPLAIMRNGRWQGCVTALRNGQPANCALAPHPCCCSGGLLSEAPACACKASK